MCCVVALATVKRYVLCCHVVWLCVVTDNTSKKVCDVTMTTVKRCVLCCHVVWLCVVTDNTSKKVCDVTMTTVKRCVLCCHVVWLCVVTDNTSEAVCAVLSRGVAVCCRRCSCHRAASGCCGTAAGQLSTMPPTWATPGQSLSDNDHSDKELVRLL